jgi:hypothetical protein
VAIASGRRPFSRSSPVTITVGGKGTTTQDGCVRILKTARMMHMLGPKISQSKLTVDVHSLDEVPKGPESQREFLSSHPQWEGPTSSPGVPLASAYVVA